jgi:Ca2+-binding RTX toxin-like protein
VTSAVHAFTLQTEDAAGNVGPGVGELLLGTQNVTTLTGTSGDDLIYAGPGVHTVAGDGGHDTFVYRETSDAPTPFLWFFGMGSYDTITDFNPAADRIDLSALGHLTYGGETMSISANHVDWYVSGGNTYVIANVGGGMLANMTIKLDGVHTLTSSDFVLS